MPASFDWEFEEEAGRPQEAVDVPPALASRRPRRRLYLAILLLLGVSALAGRAWTANRRRMTTEAEAQLRALVLLELKAISEGDAELFRSLQRSGAEAWQQWPAPPHTASEMVLLPPAPGLRPSDRPAEIIEVDISGSSANVEVVRWFVPSNGASPGPAWPFRATWFYRQARDGRWYHLPPPLSTSGEPYSWQGIRLRIEGTRDDAELLDAVAPRLDRTVVAACRFLDCPRGWRYTLSFEDTLTPQIHHLRWHLPALHLAGRPEGEAARDGWTAVLQPWLVDALGLVSHASVADRLVYQQLLERLRAELELAPRPRPDLQVLQQAFAENWGHTLQELWAAQEGAQQDRELALLNAEVTALLDLLEEQVGLQRTFDLLPQLHSERWYGRVLLTEYGIEPGVFNAAWAARLYELSGVVLESAPPPELLVPTPERLLTSPPLPFPPFQPGEQIALLCDGRVWIGDLDGENLAPLTAAGQTFSGLQWSPDGRWLVTSWQSHGSSAPPIPLYLLSPDGREGRLLTRDPDERTSPLGWSPDGRYVVYESWHAGARDDGRRTVWAIDPVTGRSRQVPEAPAWSPDGVHLAYVVTEGFEGPMGSAWLADGRWGGVRQIAERALMIWSAVNWSPDSSRLLVSLVEELASGEQTSTIAVYDVAGERLIPLLNPADLATALESGTAEYLSDGTDPAVLSDSSLQALWPFGWSADGRRFLVWAQGFDGPRPETPVALVAVSWEDAIEDGSGAIQAPEIEVLAFGRDKFVANARWSPTDPEQLLFAWHGLGLEARADEVFFFDLDASPVPVFSVAARTWLIKWSPDGEWVALLGDPTHVISHDGRTRAPLEFPRNCSDVAWNASALEDAAHIPQLHRPGSGAEME